MNVGHRSSRGGQGGRRPRHQGAPRGRRVEFSVTEDEFAAIQAAARRAGLARGAYAAQTVLGAAYGVSGSVDPVLLAELIRASQQVRRIGINLNQAVAKLNATGQRPGELLPCARACMGRVERLDAAAEAVRQALRMTGRQSA
jgi:hypothetical protein